MTRQSDEADSADAACARYDDQLYRYEIAAALNAVIRTCRDVVRHHSSYGFWTPTTTNETPTHLDLIHAARQDVLTGLHLAVSAAENVLTVIESDRTRRRRHRIPPTE